MSKIKLEKNIVLDEESPADKKTGTFYLRCSDHVDVKSITLVVSLVAHGKMSKETKKIVRFRIAENETFVKEKLHEIPFAIPLSNAYRNSYQGKNVNFDYSCKVELDVTDRDIEKIERSVFTKIKSLVTSDDTITGQRYFALNRINGRYEALEKKSLVLDFHSNLAIVPVILMAAIAFAAVIFFSQPSSIVLPGVVLALLIFGLVYQFLKMSSRQVFMDIVPTGDAFLVRLYRSNSFNWSDQKLYYTVQEKVVDKRGTSSRTYHSNLYTSLHYDLSSYDNEREFEFLYPDILDLESFSFDNASISWHVILAGKYYGIPLKFRSVFWVKRVQLLDK